MRRRPAGRAEARRRRRLRGTLPPGEGQPQSWVKGSGQGAGPGGTGELVGRRERGRGGQGPGEDGGRREGRGAAEGFPPSLEGRRHSRPAASPGAPLLLCPQARGSQIGRETAEAGWAPAAAAGGGPGDPGRALRRRSGGARNSAGRLGAQGRAGRSAGWSLSPTPGR